MVFQPFNFILKFGRMSAVCFGIAAVSLVQFPKQFGQFCGRGMGRPEAAGEGRVGTVARCHAATGEHPAASDDKLSEWQDASGKKRQLQPPVASARPSLIKIGNVAIVRFDGIDDQFRAVKLGAKLDSFTIVIVAARGRTSAHSQLSWR